MNTERQYDISIIIPVYNCESYITECFNSILAQDYDFNKIQVIMIDDGSADNSFSVCTELKGSYDNVIAVTQENRGVSGTRNRGMSLADGKYILFLDADDYLSDNAIKGIVAFFGEHYEDVDLVTYPIFNDKNGEISEHFRYQKYFSNGTAVYDLNELFYLTQTTINVAVKNNLGIQFDETMRFSEDEKFCTECLMLKGKLGYVEEARYYYRKTGVNTTVKRTNPLFTFDATMDYYQYLFGKYKDNGKVLKYIQCLFLNNFKWRFDRKEILPTYLDEQGYKEAYNRLMYLIDQLDSQTIMEMPFMPKGQQAVLLKLKKQPFDYEIDEKGKVTLIVDDVKYPFAALGINIFRCKLIGTELRIVGLLDQVCLADMDFEFSVEVKKENGKTEKIKPELKLSQYSMILQDEVIIPKYLFDVKINVENIRSIAFRIAAGANKLPSKLKFYRFSAPEISFGTYSIVYSTKGRKLVKKRDRFLKRINPLRCLKESNKKIWLYNDRDGVYDNAYYQFLHDYGKKDGVKRYYVYNDSFKEIKDKFKAVKKKHLVRYKSKKHVKLYMDSAKLITSFSDLSIYSPLGAAIHEFYGKLHYELVYLQHGILYANLRKMYTKENTEIDKFVISSDFEIKNLTENYNYNREDLIGGGMPRFSVKQNAGEKSNGKRKILLAPSWRVNLTGPLVNGKRVLDIPNFTSSTFYKGMQEFLNSEALIGLLEKNDITLDFKLHPNFRGYEDLFDFQSDRISIGFGGIALEDYDLFITDFSSYQFDFINLSRPIVYFIPDITEFRAGLHTYNKLELSSDELFGPISYDVGETVENINQIINNEFAVSQPFDTRMKEFFNIADDPCEAIYQEIK